MLSSCAASSDGGDHQEEFKFHDENEQNNSKQLAQNVKSLEKRKVGSTVDKVISIEKELKML